MVLYYNHTEELLQNQSNEDSTMNEQAKVVAEDTPSVPVQTSGQARAITPTPTKAQQKVLDGCPTTSAKIRYLNEQGYPVAQIARMLGIIYQHARNVLKQPVKNPRT